MNNKGVIVLGMSPTAKYVGKEASLFGLKSVAFDFKKGAAYYSKYFEKKELITPSSLLEKLEKEYLNSEFTYFVCPTSDEWVEFVNKNNKIFTGTNLITSSSYLDGKYEKLSDKFELLKLSESLNLNYPKSIVFRSSSDNIPNIEGLEFPVFIKPTNRSGLAHIMKGKKGWFIKDLEEWKAFGLFDTLRDIELLIQEVIIGKESNIKVLATVCNKGQISKSWVGIKERQYPVGFGSGTYVVETEDNELEYITKTLASELEYSGFFALETKYCSKRKKTYIIEVNTRPSLWFGVTTSAECNFVIKWLNTLNANVIDTEKKITDKVVWQYWYKDMFVTFNKRKKVKHSAKSYIKSYAVYDRNDVCPFVFDILNGIKKILKR